MPIKYNFMPPEQLIDVNCINGQIVLTNTKELDRRINDEPESVKVIKRNGLNPYKPRIRTRSRRQVLLDGVEGTLPK